MSKKKLTKWRNKVKLWFILHSYSLDEFVSGNAFNCCLASECPHRVSQTNATCKLRHKRKMWINREFNVIIKIRKNLPKVYDLDDKNTYRCIEWIKYV